ncbi:MAG: OmpA family protein [Planctomycetes bacterium]|nr:OmpA family protein [Planctomycetota bacterium]
MLNGLWKWAAVLTLALAVAVPGCSKKQTVKSDTDTGVVETQEAPPLNESVVVEPGEAVTEEKESLFADILFEFDRYDLTDNGRKTSQEVAAHMRKNPNDKLLIEGHCDIRGTAEYNMALGDRRAASVKNYIVSLGIPAASVSIVSYGKERPLDTGVGDAAHAKNRRAHFVLK